MNTGTGKTRRLTDTSLGNLINILLLLLLLLFSYGLNDPGIESRWGRYFPHLSRPALRPTQPPIQWVPCLSWG